MHHSSLQVRSRLHHAAAIAPLIAAVSLGLGAVATAEAAGSSHQFLLTALVNSPGGAQLGANQFAAALAAIARAQQPGRRVRTGSQINNCVAYVALRELAKARRACDEAVIAAERSKVHLSGMVATSRLAEDEQAAVAYTNRAIARCLSKEVVSCAEDLAQAHALLPEGGFVIRNLAAFQESHGEVPAVQIGTRRVGDCESCAGEAPSVKLIRSEGIAGCR